jgi:primosomal protein N' (replication factor Y) (superfamily II helicase)
MLGEGDILLGTQIIAKGLDSPDIQLSVAINADLGLNLPDFRSAERDFQMLTQLAGRTGRGETPGDCVFQTSSPEHYAIRHAVQQNYKAFYSEEIDYRRQLGYPPFKRLARFVFTASNEKSLITDVTASVKRLKKATTNLKVELLGPVPAPIERIKSKYRWQLLVKSGYSNHLTKFLETAITVFDKLKRVDTILDRDPQNMM